MLNTKFRFIRSCGFREDFFRNQPIRNKNCLWRTCLLTDRDEMIKLYRGPSIDASHLVSVHLAMRFQKRKIFKNHQNQKQVLPVAAMFVNGSRKNEQFYRGPSIDASYQVSVHLTKGFQRRRLKWEKLTDDGRQVMAKAHIAFGKVSWKSWNKSTWIY